MTRNQFPTKEQIERLRREYPKGSRVELVKMHDPQAPPIGTHGTCLGVDDIGSVMVAWNNGSHLSAAFGEDIIRRIPVMSETVKKQTLDIRNSGLTNMLDITAVQRLAFDHGYLELVDFIRTEQTRYITFIMTGKAE